MNINNIDYADFMALLRGTKEHRFFKNKVPEKIAKEVKGAMISLTCKKDMNLDKIAKYAQEIIKGFNSNANIIWSAIIKDDAKENTAEIMVVK